MSTTPADGLITRTTPASVDVTVDRITAILAAKAITLFAVIDHSGEAARAGFTMPSTRVIVFGNPRAGTPLMLDAPSIAIDLPLRILVADDGAGTTSVSYTDARYLIARHHLSPELARPLESVAAIVTEATR